MDLLGLVAGRSRKVVVGSQADPCQGSYFIRSTEVCFHRLKSVPPTYSGGWFLFINFRIKYPVNWMGTERLEH